MFGVPLDTSNNVLDETLKPVMPKSLRHLQLARDAFESGNFDPMVKQRLLASLLCYMKSDKVVKDSSRWNGVPNVTPTSTKYQGPPGVRLK